MTAKEIMLVRNNNIMHDKNQRFFLTAMAVLAAAHFSGCVNKPAPALPRTSAPAMAKDALHTVGKDMRQVGKDLTGAQPAAPAQLGKDAHQLGSDMSNLAFQFKSLGDYGSPPSPLAQHLGALGNDLEAGGAEIATLGAEEQAGVGIGSVTPTAAHLDTVEGDLTSIAGDLAAPDPASAVLANDLISVNADTKTWISHIDALNKDLAAGKNLETLGPDMTALGTDFSGMGGVTRTEATNVFANPRIVAGYITLNPYTITTVTTPGGGSAEKLESSSTTGAATVQVDYARRWSWDQRSTVNHSGETLWNGGIDWKRLDSYDLQFRGGYTFTSSSNTSTIIGSGNVDLELGGGLQVVRWANASGSGNLNLDLGVETDSDRSFAAAHSTYFLGPAFVTSVPILSTNRAFMMFRIGSAMYDIPAFTTGGYISTNGTGSPNFSHVIGLAAEFEAAYPIASGTQLVANARIYPSHTIAPWTVWLGVSVSADKLTALGSSLLNIF
jgi:hypothetical protein